MTMSMIPKMIVTNQVDKKLGDLNLNVRTGLGMLDCTLSGEHGMNIRPLGAQAKAEGLSSICTLRPGFSSFSGGFSQALALSTTFGS